METESRPVRERGGWLRRAAALLGAARERVAQRAQRRALRGFYSGLIKPNDLCFDVGANVGARAEILLELGARVVCVEPQPKCVAALRARFGGNPRVVIAPVGVAAQAGELPMAVCDGEDMISTFSPRWQAGRFHDRPWRTTLTAPVTTLDALVREHGEPAFCKLDVEGFELEALRGLSAAPPLVSFEFTREFFDDAVACMARLAILRSGEFNCVIGEDAHFLQSEWRSGPDLAERLSGLKNELLWGDIYYRWRR